MILGGSENIAYFCGYIRKVIIGMNIGVFVGSFDPFTIGHDSLVRRALPLFDKLVIGVVGDNVHKPNMTPANQRMDAIATLYRKNPHIEVKVYDGLAMDFAKDVGAHFIVKGIRNVNDLEYERAQAYFNQKLGGIETILLYTEPELMNVSSTAVRELSHFGKDISFLLPKNESNKE